jgi:Tfp pilus assembly PilM family ATPase/Tfp pilus assembly protein PilN
MARYLALEWNEDEARLAVAGSQGDAMVVEHAFTVNLRCESADASGPADFGKRISEALSARGIARQESLVAIGRTSIELRQLTIPPAPDDDLPDMVRFQALREFNAMQEDWALDFMPIDDDPTQPRTVLAAAIAPDQIAQIQQTCQSAGLRAKRLVLRPCGAASLFSRRHSEGRFRVRLLVDVLAEEADLTVMIDRKVIFLRTARLPADPLAAPDGIPALAGEIRRTIAAVQNQLGGRIVESIVLCGSGDEHGKLAETLDQRLGMPVTLFDPFEGLKLEGELVRGLPEHAGRFAPLLGILQDEILHEHPSVDFLHPRRRPPPPSRTRPMLYLAAALTAVVGLIFTVVTVRQWKLRGELDSVRNQITDADLLIKEMEAAKKTVDEVDKWRGNDVVLLEEMRWLAEKLPSAEKVKLTEIGFKQGQYSGDIHLQGFAASSEAVGDLERKLSDSTHQVVPIKQNAVGEAPYPYKFDNTIRIGQKSAAREKTAPDKKAPRPEAKP